MEYVPGGTASGLNHVLPEEMPTRLLHIKGRRNVRLTQVPLSVASLNHGDVFILDHAGNIFVVRGTPAPRPSRPTCATCSHCRSRSAPQRRR